MSGSNSNRLRLTGKLIKGERRYILQCEDESVWRLEFQDDDQPKDNEKVVVEGVRIETDIIKVDWIGERPQA